MLTIAIMLARIKSSLPEVRRALLELDDVTLTIDNLKAISKQLPTSDEVTPSDRLYLSSVLIYPR